MPAPIPDDERAAILDDVRAGQLSCKAIGRKHGRSASAVSGIAKAAGIVDAFGRSQTKEATAARVADQAERRAELADLNLTVAAEALVKLREVLVRARGVKDVAIAYGVLVDKHLVLAPPTDGAEEGRRRIVEFMDALRAGVEAAPVAEAGESR